MVGLASKLRLINSEGLHPRDTCDLLRERANEHDVRFRQDKDWTRDGVWQALCGAQERCAALGIHHDLISQTIRDEAKPGLQEDELLRLVCKEYQKVAMRLCIQRILTPALRQPIRIRRHSAKRIHFSHATNSEWLDMGRWTGAFIANGN
jgi:hypothetical protein